MQPIDPAIRHKASSLHYCLRHALWLVRWAGFLPVQGLSQSPENITFKLKHFYTLYFIPSIIGQITMVGFSIKYFRDNEIRLSSISNILFYGSNCTIAFLLIKFSYKWQNFAIKTALTEDSLTEVKICNRVFVKSTATAYTIMGLGLVEHLLCSIYYIKFIMTCLNEDSLNDNVIENYVKFRFPFVFHYIAYNIPNMILIEFICLQSTFLWSFGDVLTICFSIYITSYFRNLTKVIYYKKNNKHPSWKLLREHYSKLVALVKDIDAELSSFILVSFICSLFYICLQLFNSLHRNFIYFDRCDEEKLETARSSPEHLLYYVFSFLFLLMRALTLSMFAANVHYSAVEPLVAIYDVPSLDYDHEVKRFQIQLRYTDVGLSGKFFIVNRNMLLRVIGTIITYELVLLQFSKFPVHSNNATNVMS